jgi:hypothetical protein
METGPGWRSHYSTLPDRKNPEPETAREDRPSHDQLGGRTVVALVVIDEAVGERRAAQTELDDCARRSLPARAW